PRGLSGSCRALGGFARRTLVLLLLDPRERKTALAGEDRLERAVGPRERALAIEREDHAAERVFLVGDRQRGERALARRRDRCDTRPRGRKPRRVLVHGAQKHGLAGAHRVREWHVAGYRDVLVLLRGGVIAVARYRE